MIKNTRKGLSALYLFPLLLIAVIVPIIVYLKVVTLDSLSYQYWTGQEQNADFFSYYKAMATIAFSVLSLIAFFYARYKNLINTKQLSIYYIPILIYAMLVILSTALSKYPITAKLGFVDRYEGVYVLLAYITILFTSISFLNSEKSIKFILTGLFISAVVIGTIGIFQFFGLDLFKSSIGKDIILPPRYKNLDLNFLFGAHTIYSTLYNTNYVGSYTAILLPLALMAFFYVRKPYMRVGMGLLACLVFANWLGCRSRAGYMGGAVAVLLLIVLMRKVIFKNYKLALSLLLSFLIIAFGMDSFAKGILSKRIVTTIEQVSDYNKPKNPANNSQVSIPSVNLKDISASGDKASIICDKNSLFLTYKDNQVGFMDDQGKTLEIQIDDQGTITFAKPGYEPYQIRFDTNTGLFEIKINSSILNLLLNKDGFNIMGERGILVNSVDHPATFGFSGKEKFASSRGYIWSRSIPLLKNNILVGGGPDTYVFQFPQHDYVGKLKAFDMTTQMVDKPHNMYLQIAINTGVLSLISLLFIFAAYAISSIRLFFNTKLPDKRSVIGISIFCAVTGYLVAGLANDSLVSVAPIFWLVLGMGISCNYMIKYGTDKPDVIKATSAKLSSAGSKGARSGKNASSGRNK